MSERVVHSWYSNDLLPTSLSNLRTSTRSDDVMIILEIFRMSSEKYWMDYQILIIEHFYATFRKALKCEMIIHLERVDPLGVYPTSYYNDL